MDMQKAVESAMTNLVESGKIEQMIEKQLEETVKSIIVDVLRSYSDFGKKIKESLEKAVNLGNVDFPDYNQLLSTWVLEIVSRSMIQVGREQIEANLKTFFQPLEKAEWNASEIVEKFIENIRKDAPGDGGEITCIVETNEHDGIESLRKFWSIYLDENTGIQKYKCKYQIHVRGDEGVWRSVIDGADSREVKSQTFYGFENFIFKLYATKAKIINDKDNISTEYGYDD